MALVVKVISLVLVGLLCGTSAFARPHVSNNVSYFPVRGTSASAIYTSLVVNGPGGQSGSAMATTNASISQTFKLRQGKRCRLTHYRINVKIITQLPRLVSIKRLSSSMRRTWHSFNNYVRRHEARHKAIYINCARKIEASARRLARASSCNGAASAIVRARYTELAKCEALHSSYDRREYSRIKRLGLITRATRPSFNRKKKKRRK